MRTLTKTTPPAEPDAAPFDGMLIGHDARTLGANVTTALRSAIIEGKLPPGLPLGQEYLARRFGVSRVPIRESLKQLAAEGLVELEPHKGAIVARLSLEELDEFYGIIWSLETLAVRVGVPLLTDGDLTAMKAVVQRLDVVDDAVQWYQLSVSFHRMILVAARWPRCLRIIDECRKNIGRYITEQQFFAEHVNQWRRRNRALFKACSGRDVEGAVKALDAMRRFSTAQVREHLKQSLEASRALAPGAAPWRPYGKSG